MRNVANIACVLAVVIASACVPEPGTAEYEKYLEHKANRAAVQYQGF